ncbi:MAG: hypothetical protein ACYDGN_18185, partial [Acidimicrobiales bacterium]
MLPAGLPIVGMAVTPGGRGYQNAAQCPGIHAGGEAPPSLRRSGLGLDVLAQDRKRCATGRS